MTARLVVLLFVSFLGFIAPAPVRADDEAAALLAKHKAYVGWEFGDGTFKTLRVEGALSRLGKDGKLTPVETYVDLRRGAVHREVRASLESGGSSISGFTGTIFWYSDENGFTVPLASERLKTTLAQMVVLDEATVMYSAVLRRRDSVNGKSVAVLREKLPATSVDLYVDPQTGAYLRAVIDPDGKPRSIDIDEYAEIAPGKRHVVAWHVTGSQYRHIEKFTANPALADDDFRPPPQRASWVFAPPKPFPIEVTPQRIYFLATVDGKQGRFMLDTGSYGILFTREFSARAKLRVVGSTEGVGLTGSARVNRVEIGTIQFDDGSQLKNVSARESPRFFGAEEHIDGIMGFTFLAGAIVDTDLDGRLMTLYDPKLSAPDESQGVVFVADLESGIPSVPVKVNGTTSLEAILDSGNPLHVLISAELTGKLRVLLDNATLGSYQYMGGALGGEELVRCGSLTNIQFGPVDYVAPPFCFTSAMDPDQALIGFDFLQHFNMVFDYPDSKIIMVPRKR
jgi:hypothetical protein